MPPGKSIGLAGTRRHQTCHFRKRAAHVPAEGPAYGLLGKVRAKTSGSIPEDCKPQRANPFGGSTPWRSSEKGSSGLSQNKDFREHSRKQRKQSWVFLVEQKFREVLVLAPSKVIHLNFSPRSWGGWLGYPHHGRPRRSGPTPPWRQSADWASPHTQNLKAQRIRRKI